MSDTKNGAAVAVREPPKGIVGLLGSDAARLRIEPFLPAGVRVDRVIAAATMATKVTPDLLKCTPESIVMAVARIQQWGLEIGTTAHLVPFNTKVKLPDGKEEYQKICTPVADYKGLIELMVASRAVRMVEARCVHEGDHFVYRQGLNPQLDHIPCSDHKTRGRIIGAYCVLRLPFGSSVFEFMSIEDIDEIRIKHSKQWKNGPCPPWYAKKTVVRQGSKMVPKGSNVANALAVMAQDTQEEFGTFEIPAALAGDDRPRIGAGAAEEEENFEDAEFPEDLGS